MFVYFTNYISWSDLTDWADSECENHRNHVILTKKLKNCTWTASKVPPSSRSKIDKNMEITNFPTVGPKRSLHCPGPSEGLKIWRQAKKEGHLKENVLRLLTYLLSRALRFRRLYCLTPVPGIHFLGLSGFDSSFGLVMMSEETVCPRKGPIINYVTIF